jgi:HEAT repeat protein
VPALKKALADKDWLVRFRASQALASIKGQKQATASAKTLKRVKVIMKGIVKDLIPQLYDSRAWVSSQAKTALRAIDTPEARRVLRNYNRRR